MSRSSLAPLEPLGALAVSILGAVEARARPGPEGKSERQSARGTAVAPPLLYVVAGERRGAALADLLAGLAPTLGVALLPAWDALPYDRTPPSRAIMGRRAGVLHWLADPEAGPDVVIATPAALLRRVPPPQVWAGSRTEFRVGDSLDPAAVEARLRRAGYVEDDRVDEPGEMAARGRVFDLFPAAAPKPCRVEFEDGKVTAIRSYDPVTQRSVADADVLVVDPATEAVVPEGGSTKDPDEPGSDAPASEAAGIEARLCELYPELASVFDLLPGASVAVEPEAEARLQAALEQVQEAFEARRSFGGRREAPSPDRLFLDGTAWSEALEERLRLTVEPGATQDRVPAFAKETRPAQAFGAYLVQETAAGRRVVLASATPRDQKALARTAERALGQRPEPVADWAAVLAAPEGTLLALPLALHEGFAVPDAGVSVVAARDVLGRRASDGLVTAQAVLPIGETEFRAGDTVVHVEHGLGVLEGIETLEPAPGEFQDTVRLRYAGDTHRLVPVDEIGAIWRYGGEADAVSLDRLDGTAWQRRRAQVEAEIQDTAEALARLAADRDAQVAPRLKPPEHEFDRFVARFAYAASPDQAQAVEAVLADLASGRPMNRLVCGDVGFGKTEVALRAAAAAVLAGRQVAVAAPTTVLVRQHLKTFQRRFAPLGIRVAGLSRLTAPQDARAVKAGLASGEIRLVVGTHALAAKGVAFKELGLVVIDEEQRFGTRDKERLRSLAKTVHLLTLTATPIPRTLQGALVGLQDLSVIATPPVLRQPIRTVIEPFDVALVDEALLRERRRGGQSFVVCPRVEDLEPIAGQLRKAVPDLAVAIAHGGLPADELDAAMVGFADGDGDVLLATSIIESGLDVPNANTMVVWRPDRFGLSQLHQLRGRVGRASRRGLVILATDPAESLKPATLKRLKTLESLDRLGAGFAIATRDLDLRGAGDLLGDRQAGHMRLIGAGLYQSMMDRAIAALRGETIEDWRPELRFGSSGSIPAAYVPDDDLRISLYIRLERLADAEAIEAFEDELSDRFGPPPPELAQRLGLAKLRILARDLGIGQIDAGPQGVAATFREGREARFRHVQTQDGELSWRGERLVVGRQTTDGEARLRLALTLLAQLTHLAAEPERAAA